MDIDAVSICYLVSVTVICVALIIANRVQDWMIKGYKEIVASLERQNTVTLEYCLRHIIKSSIEKEDYEAAREAKEQLDEILKLKNK